MKLADELRGVGWLVGAAAFAVAVLACANSGPEVDPREAAAWDLCTRAMRAQAIAPSSATFPALPDPDITVRRMGAVGQYEVHGWMDAENRIGGRAGADFVCVATPGESKAMIVSVANRGQ